MRFWIGGRSEDCLFRRTTNATTPIGSITTKANNLCIAPSGHIGAMRCIIIGSVNNIDQ